MKEEPVWLERAWVDRIYEAQIRQHGGHYGVRDEGLIESALARPRNLYLYENPDLFDLAAAYGFGLARNHGYVDGNKRIGFMAMVVFLDMHGHELQASQEEAYDVTMRLSSGELDEAELAAWLRANA